MYLAIKYCFESIYDVARQALELVSTAISNGIDCWAPVRCRSGGVY